MGANASCTDAKRSLLVAQGSFARREDGQSSPQDVRSNSRGHVGKSTQDGFGQEAIVPATRTRRIDPATPLAAPSFEMDVTAGRVFTALERLHGIPARDDDLLYRASAGLRFIRSTGTYTELEHGLFRIALAELDPVEASVVEAAACYAADLVPFGERPDMYPADSDVLHRALWFAAVIRIAEALCPRVGAEPEAVFAVWTDSAIYLEFDGNCVSERRLAEATNRVAALEVLTGRKVLVAGSNLRRGAA
jgi:hypothetical protein